ncbi:flagellar filament capping protein FliD [Phorcysia thermohydrogeniphila]|uniref:Flagellar hook-associated protein 2 n=1 Tax=Phorcysia thermohydrogeniphila TaxID=936138 RepID=A0A4R1GQ49_9BACT|nr:flagellar filament capping protein FliD [Phorcysia thermohydrogeniphila]TCK06642.1 flagellar hook-associated protein 2 [Phorcysia thermohydrogeniphila]
MAGEFYISNLAGTFDYQTILDAYYQAQMQPVLMLQEQESTLNSKISAINEFQDLISNFYNVFDELTSTNILEQKVAFSSDESVLSVKVTDPLKAQVGSYDVTVKQLAKNDVWLSVNGVASTDSVPATTAGTLQISYAGTVIATVDYDTDTNTSTPSTLQEIASAINSAQDKVIASVIYDGSQYRLLLSGKDTGETNVISITEIGSGDLLDQLQLGDSYTSSHVQQAQDAIITLYGQDISSPTNTFNEAIPGLELSVKATSSTAVSITVENDYTSFEETFQNFINAYNSIVDFVQTESSKDGRLSGNTTLQMIRSSILSKLQPLFDNNLIDVDKDTGHLTLDSLALEDMLSSTPESVESLLQSLKTNLYDYLIYLKSPSGPVDAYEKSLENQKSYLEEQISEMQKLITEQVEQFRQELIQVQLLQEEMEAIRAKIVSVFGNTSLLPTTSS